MGASNSRPEEGKALQLCRARKKFVRQALDGRCSLAAAHIAYIQSLKTTGIALRRFVEPDLVATEKSNSQFSLSSPSRSHPGDGTIENPSRSSTPPSSRRFQVHHMKFKGFRSRKVEEKPPVAVTATALASSSTTQDAAAPPQSTEKPAASPPFEPPPCTTPGAPQWDFFQLSHPIDNEFSFLKENEDSHGFEHGDVARLKEEEEEGIPELDKGLRESDDGYDDSEKDEFDDDPPPSERLVRSYQNVNRVHDHVSATPTMPSAGSLASEGELLNMEKSNSPPSSAVAVSAEKKQTPAKEDQNENKVAAKDFFSSMKDVEYLFIKASESGKEVPRMLEANKFQFRPIAATKDDGSVASTFLNACFSCGQDPKHVPEEPVQDAVKYLVWHRTTSSRSSSSRTPLGMDSKHDGEDLFESFCMISGSHASTLDRLHAWERKLYDEVKASEMVRREYDAKCRFLQQLESKNESSYRIDKTRASVKDLHSRIRVAIQRIDSISMRIEELRDKELQPQLEELIKGLSRMWEAMLECHRLQHAIITTASTNARIALQPESRSQITLHLENELGSLSSTFAKWMNSQKSYLKSINDWLFTCVVLPEKTSRRKKRASNHPSSTLRRFGAPIYATCGVWLDKFESLPDREVVESIKGLATETLQFIPRQDKKQGKKTTPSACRSDDVDVAAAPERFRTSLEGLIGQLCRFAELSVDMYREVEKAICDAKHQFEANSRMQAQTG